MGQARLERPAHRPAAHRRRSRRNPRRDQSLRHIARYHRVSTATVRCILASQRYEKQVLRKTPLVSLTNQWPDLTDLAALNV